MVRFKPIVVLALAAALALAGCSAGSGTPDGESSESGAPAALAESVTIAVPSVPGTFDVASMVWTQVAPFAQAAYDSLVSANGDGTFSPNLATEWSYDDTRTVLTMKLRDDVTFEDGTKLDAEAAALNVMRNRNTPSSNASQIRAIESATAVDATTLKITLSEPSPGVIVSLAKNLGMVQNPATFDDPAVATNPVGSGPYTLDTANTTAGSTYTYVMKDDYWNPSAVHYKQIVIKVISDPTAMLNGLKANQFDVAGINGKIVAPLKGSDYEIESRAQAYQGLLIFDRDGELTPALGDVRVRQAINYAFDREALVKALLDGHGTATTQIFDPDGLAYIKSFDDAYPYDPKKAKKLLAEAGYADGFTLNTLQTSLFPPTIYTLMAQQLADVGITVNYTDVGTNFAPSLFSGQFSAGFAQIPIEASDWSAVATFLNATATGNPFKVADDPKVAEWIETVRMGDPEDPAVKDAYQSINTYTVEENATYAPWYRVDTLFAHASDVDLKLGSGNIFPNLWTIQPAK